MPEQASPAPEGYTTVAPWVVTDDTGGPFSTSSPRPSGGRGTWAGVDRGWLDRSR